MKKTKKEEKKQEEIFKPIVDPFLGDSAWLLALTTLALFTPPKSESKTTINIYTGSDK
jgi:hypothetical protein